MGSFVYGNETEHQCSQTLSCWGCCWFSLTCFDRRDSSCTGSPVSPISLRLLIIFWNVPTAGCCCAYYELIRWSYLIAFNLRYWETQSSSGLVCHEFLSKLSPVWIALTSYKQHSSEVLGPPFAVNKHRKHNFFENNLPAHMCLPCSFILHDGMHGVFV